LLPFRSPICDKNISMIAPLEDSNSRADVLYFSFDSLAGLKARLELSYFTSQTQESRLKFFHL
ncbi:MAG: hypothetical protein OXC19_02595, partial [Bryobacterales bacterium]|nr:hypothetical protein [Bryobacterales bacterium]